MARTTYRYLAYDLISTYNQMNDDAEIGITQAVFWINVIANRLRMQHIRKLDTGAHLSVFTGVPISIESNTNRKYFSLPETIYDFKHEKGVKYITYQDVTDCCEVPAFTQILFNQTDSGKAHRLYFDPYEKPTAKNPYFYRVGRKIFILGLECIDVPKGLEMGLYTTIDPNTAGCNLDDELDLSEELITVLKYEVLNLGKFALIIPNERINEGADQTTQALRQEEINIPTIKQPGETQEEQQNQ